MRHPQLLLPLLLLTTGCELARGSSAVQAPAKSAYATTAVGRIDSASEARQLVAATDGVIAVVLVKRGERVRPGQVLLRVDCGQRQQSAMAMRDEADRAAAAAATILAGSRSQEIVAVHEAVRAAQAERSDAAERLTQAEALAGPGFISRRDLSARRNALTSVDASYRSALARTSLTDEGPRGSERREASAAARAATGQAQAAAALAGQCNLISPIDGEVLQILRREGEFSGASQGTPLMVVGDLGRLIVRAEISERDAGQVRLGQAADVWIEGETRHWTGRVTELASVMGRRSARSLDPTDRFDRDVREAFVALDGTLPPRLVGLRVTVGLQP